VNRTLNEWLRIFEENDVPCGPVNSLREVFSDPHVLHREMVTEVEHAKVGKIKQVGFPLKFSEKWRVIRQPPPILGEHTVEVLREIGYNDEEIENFRKKGVI